MSDKKTVFQAVSAVMNDVRSVGKDGKNTFDNYNFRGIDGVMNGVGPALRAHGVIAVPTVDHIDYGSTTTNKGAVMTTVRLKMIVRWYGPAGDNFETVVWGEAFDRGDKATAKAHSVAFRTAMLETLCLPTQEPDPDEDSYEQARPTQEQREAKRKADLEDWATKLLGFEKQGNIQQVQAGVEWAKKAGDRDKFNYAQGIAQRMQQQPMEPQQVGEVLDAQVVTDG